MAAITMYVHFSDTPRVDGLCPHCLNPSLRYYTRERIDMDGITIIGGRTACLDCKVWVDEPLKESA